MHIPDEIVRTVYDFDPFNLPANKHIRKYLQTKRNYYANKIQTWYKRNKIQDKMPLLFLDEVMIYEKWYIIRLYMKFYPKDDLRDWPLHCIKRKLNIYNRSLPNEYNKLYSAFEVFEFMKNETKETIIATGF